MIYLGNRPRILLISQWPKVKNGEYELIEKIKQTECKITVVDYLGFDVDSGECLNDEKMAKEYDFAISFHYETPKLLNVPTFLWVANPLEFMHLRGDYRNVLLHNMRAYDDYLYNGSDTLKTHISQIVGRAWRDTDLEMFPSCSEASLLPLMDQASRELEKARKLFYCGVNWERGIDRKGRAQGLLDILQSQDAADFYGPDKLEGISPWEGFSSYRGEIPFDGVSMAKVMRDYGAVLAVSSPAHMKSRTSSSRVFEGVAAGVPVISDENPHVRHLFGESVYYFNGNNVEEQAKSIISRLQEINRNPEEALRRASQAQALMRQRFCFESCFDKILKHARSQAIASPALEGKQILDLMLFQHEPDAIPGEVSGSFKNLQYIISAAAHAAQSSQVLVRINCFVESENFFKSPLLPEGVTWKNLRTCDVSSKPWAQLRLGEKVALLSQQASGDFLSFLSTCDYPHYDHLSKALDWFREEPISRANGVHVAGFYVNGLARSAPTNTNEILRINSSTGLYRWTQNSLAEHQLGTLTFHRDAVDMLDMRSLARLDVLLPISIVLSAMEKRRPIHRSRYITLRVDNGSFHRHYEAYRAAVQRGFWSQHYELVTNYNHELNALYDLHHEVYESREIVDKISGQNAGSVLQPVDPAVHAVNQFLNLLRPWYHRYLKVRRVLSLKGLRQ